MLRWLPGLLAARPAGWEAAASLCPDLPLSPLPISHREMRELEALELQRLGEAPPQQGAAAPPAAQASEEQRRAALQLSGDDAWRRRAGLAAAPGGGAGLGAGGGAPAPAGSGGGPKGMSLAQKLMEKMGWREGEGLGRNRQGMATPLMMQKTDVRSGVIVNAAPAPSAAGAAEQPPKRQRSATFNRPPTRVVLLTNMVGGWVGTQRAAAAAWDRSGLGRSRRLPGSLCPHAHP